MAVFDRTLLGMDRDIGSQPHLSLLAARCSITWPAACLGNEKLPEGALAVLGFKLLPLSWWNDAFVSLPLALAFRMAGEFRLLGLMEGNDA
jgi:hypothetical protein